MSNGLINLKTIFSFLLLISINISGIKLVKLHEFNKNEVKKNNFFKKFLPIVSDSYKNYYQSFGFRTSLTMNFDIFTRHVSTLNELINNKNELLNKISTLKYILNSNMSLACDEFSDKNKNIIEELKKLNYYKIEKHKNQLSITYYPDDPCTYLIKSTILYINELEKELKDIDKNIILTQIRDEKIIHLFN